MKAHVLTGTGATRGVAMVNGGRIESDGRGGVKYLPPTDPADQEGADELPGVDIETTDNPALDGQLSEQPSVRADGFDAEQAAKWIRTAAAVQEATGKKEDGIDWKGLAAALSAGAASGAAIGGPVGALVGAILGAFFWCMRSYNDYVASMPWNAYPDSWNFCIGAMPYPVVDYFLSDDMMGIFAAGPKAMAQHIANVMLMPQTVEQIQGDSSWRRTISEAIRGYDNVGQVFTDTERLLWHATDGRAIPFSWYFETMGNYDGCKAHYTQVGIDYPLTRLMANPAGSQSADPSVAGIVSDGSGGVYMRKGALFVYEGAIEQLDDSAGDDSAGASGGGSAALAALALLGFAAISKTH